MDKLIILGFLIAATVMESGGDAIVRMGLTQQAPGLRALYFLAGAALLFGYGFTLNLAPISFGRVVGVYVATLFVVWQVITFIAFRSLPTPPILIGGALVVVGGAIVAFWEPRNHVSSNFKRTHHRISAPPCVPSSFSCMPIVVKPPRLI
jgi:hypothetical protein